jgi:hypothetical protein
VIWLAAFVAGMGALVRWAVGQAAPQGLAPRSIDDGRVRAAGLRILKSKHLTLYTDLPADAEVDRLPAVFDQAVPQWAAYFGFGGGGAGDDRLDPRARNWQATACLIKDRAKFDALGLMPPRGSDEFVNGISLGNRFWFYEQPTPYYRRHLLLHEGTHAFMASLLGGCGPGWYMEGTAELMATHHLDESTGRLTLRVMPRDREQVPMLGRIELIRDARKEKRLLGLPAVMEIDNRRILENESYAWCWSVAVFLDSHPRYRERFRSLRRHVTERSFNEIFRREYADDWNNLSREWQAFVAALDHGFDFERMAIDFRPGGPLREGQQKVVEVQADRGWQSSLVRVEAGRTHRISASGRFQIAEEVDGGGVKRQWLSEAGGVTLEYYAGRPLGILLGAIVSNRSDDVNGDAEPPGFSEPIIIGLGTTFQPRISGTLYLRINDDPGRLHDNRGSLTVTVL